MLFILYVLFCLIFIFYYFSTMQLRLRKVKYLSQGHKVSQPNFKHHILLPYLKTKEIFFFFHSQDSLQGNFWMWSHKKDICPHSKVSTNIKSCNVFLVIILLFVCTVIAIMLSGVH